FTGSPNTPLSELITPIFPEFAPSDFGAAAHRCDRWRHYSLHDRGTISILDARDADRLDLVREELSAQPADVIFFVDDEDRKKMRREPLENVVEVAARNGREEWPAGIIGIIYDAAAAHAPNGRTDDADLADRASR